MSNDVVSTYVGCGAWCGSHPQFAPHWEIGDGFWPLGAGIPTAGSTVLCGVGRDRVFACHRASPAVCKMHAFAEKRKKKHGPLTTNDNPTASDATQLGTQSQSLKSLCPVNTVPADVRANAGQPCLQMNGQPFHHWALCLVNVGPEIPISIDPVSYIPEHPGHPPPAPSNHPIDAPCLLSATEPGDHASFRHFPRAPPPHLGATQERLQLDASRPSRPLALAGGVMDTCSRLQHPKTDWTRRDPSMRHTVKLKDHAHKPQFPGRAGARLTCRCRGERFVSNIGTWQEGHARLAAEMDGNREEVPPRTLHSSTHRHLSLKLPSAISTAQGWAGRISISRRR